MAVGDADFAIGARRAFARDQERQHARQVGLERDRHHVGHQLEVLGEIRRNAVRLVHVRIDLRVVLFRLFDLPLDLADRGEVLVELALVGGSEVGLQLLRVVGDEIENAAAVLFFCGARFRAQRGAVAEQPLEQRARIENRRQRLRLAAPGQIVGVRAGVSGIAIAGLARVFEADFERREARLVADLVGDELVAGNAGLDVDDRLLDLNAGEVGAAAAAVIARAIEQRAPVVVRQVAEQQ